MKQFLLLSLMTLAGGVGALHSPFWGVLLYYTLAVLRPQYLWAWALPMDVRWSLLAALIVLIGVMLNVGRLMNRAALNLVLGLMIAHGIMLMFSVLTAYHPAIAEHYGTEYAKVLLLAAVASLVIEQLWQVRWLGWMVFATVGYIAWEINSMYFLQGGRLDLYHYGYGGLDNNGAGLMLAMGLPFTYAVAFSSGGWQRARLTAGGVIGACMLHAVLMSYSRGAMLALCVGGAWLLIHHRPRWQAAGLAVAGVLALSLMAGPEIRERFTSIGDYQTDASAQSRLESWSAAWQITWDDPLLGKGIRNSNEYSHNYGADRRGRTIHNQYLQIAADSGVPAALAYVALMGVAIWRLGSSRRMCMSHMMERADREGPMRQASSAEQEIDASQKVCLAAQTSLIMFGFGAMFLSLELFELPWLLFVMAGVLPRLVAQRLNEIEDVRDEMVADEARPAFGGRGGVQGAV